jgi:hypothetical protein
MIPSAADYIQLPSFVHIVCPLFRGEYCLKDLVPRGIVSHGQVRRNPLKPDSIKSDSDTEPGSPPPGAWFDKTFDGFVVGATTRSRTSLLYGILGTFLCAAGGVFFHAFWDNENFTLFTRVFVDLVFFVPGAALWIRALMYLFGKIVVAVDGHRGNVFTGIGTLGITRRFNWLDVSEARLVRYRYFRKIDMKKALFIDKDREDRLPEETRIIIEEKRRIRFGGMLSSDRRYFVASVINQMLKRRDSR